MEEIAESTMTNCCLCGVYRIWGETAVYTEPGNHLCGVCRPLGYLWCVLSSIPKCVELVGLWESLKYVLILSAVCVKGLKLLVDNLAEQLSWVR